MVPYTMFSLFSFIVMLTQVHGQSAGSALITDLLESLLTQYDVRLRPNYLGAPTEVGISMFIMDIPSISDSNGDFTVDMYLRQTWEDPRLSFSETDAGPYGPIKMGARFVRSFWVPDTFFVNAKDAKSQELPSKTTFVRIQSSGEVLLSQKLTVTATCKANLMYFPMDSRVCSLEIESYGFSMTDVSPKWMHGLNRSVTLSSPLPEPPEFILRGTRLTQRFEMLATGQYSRMSCEFLFSRKVAPYLVTTYIPATLLVMLSWASFWIRSPRDRFVLGITTTLTLTLFILATHVTLPRGRHVTSLDVFLLTCFVMVLASLLQNVVVSYLDDAESTASPVGHSAKYSADVDPGTGQHKQSNKKSSRATIDILSRVVFPLAFVIFSMVYWIAYVVLGKQDDLTGFRMQD